MPFDIIIHYPSENRTKTVGDVVSFEIEFGDENRIIADQTNGRAFEDSAIGLAVTGATDTEYFD